jgi:hypothetical protein
LCLVFAAHSTAQDPPLGDEPVLVVQEAEELFIGEIGLLDDATNLTAEQKQKMLRLAKKQEEKKLLRRLNLRIGELQKVCKLSPKQVRRLQLAAKGAVKDKLKNFEDMAKKLQAEIDGIGFAIAVDEVEEPEGADDLPDVPPRLGAGDDPQTNDPSNSPTDPTDQELVAFRKETEAMFGPMNMMFGRLSDVEEHKLWQTQLQNTLSSDQQVAREKHLLSRRTFRRKVAVLRLVAEYDDRMLLTTNQRELLTDIVDAQLGKFFERLGNQRQDYLLDSVAYLSSTRLAMGRLRKGAKAFLSDEQLTEMRRSPNEQWEGIGMILNGGFEADFLAPPVEVPADAGFLGLTMGEDPSGVEVQHVREGLASDKAGVKAGDIIQSFNGEEITLLNELLTALAETKPSQKVKLAITRDGKPVEIEVTLGSRK